MSSGPNRRSFLKGSLAAGTGLAISGFSSRSDARPWIAPRTGLPTIQLFTDETSAQFRILVDRLSPVRYELTSSDGHAPLLESVTQTPDPFTDRVAIDHLLVTGLRLGVTYTLKTISKVNGSLLDEREFLALDTRKPNGRFALVSCMFDLLLPVQAGMWEALETARPDVIFIIGDSSYTDFDSDGSLKDMWKRHVQSRRTLDLYYFKRLIPVLATWDDHDFAGNNADKTAALNGKSIDVFRAMFGWTLRGPAFLGLGVSFVVELFGQRFFMMDCRTFRDPYETPRGLHWGNEQEGWLLSNLAAKTKPAWILNGSQFFGAYLNKDSFQQRHPYQFERFLTHLQSIAAPVVFGSGDVHFSELMQIEKSILGYETFEITSSSMHSMTTPLINARHVNPRRLLTTWRHNFVIAQGAPHPDRFSFRVTSTGRGGQVYFDKISNVYRTSKNLVR